MIRLFWAILIEFHLFIWSSRAASSSVCVHAGICHGSTDSIKAKTVPTTGTNMATVVYKKITLDIRELGASMASVWPDFFKECTTILVRFRLRNSHIFYIIVIAWNTNVHCPYSVFCWSVEENADPIFNCGISPNDSAQRCQGQACTHHL